MKKIIRLFFSIFVIFLFAFSSASASDIIVTSKQIKTFKGKKIGEKVDGLIWRGGIELTSESKIFGGLSGITFTGANNQFTMVSDIGYFFTGKLVYDKTGAPLALDNVLASLITNSKGAALPRKFAKDAEAIDVIYRQNKPAAIRVGFENLTRVADFELINGKPKGAALIVAIPSALSNERTNASLESLCIAPPTSPIAGSTLLITEKMLENGSVVGFMLGVKDRGRLHLKKAIGLNPTDCAFLENGDLLILERGIGFLSFTMQLRLVKADEVQPGAMLRGKSILKASGGDIDNMEGLAIHKNENGVEIITIISDDNFNGWEKNLLLQFSLN